MKGTYPAFFTETDDAILIEVPDLEILTEGVNIINAFDMASDAIGLKCSYLEDNHMEIPRPSDIQSLHPEESEFAAHGITDIVYVDVDTEKYREKISMK